MLTNFKWYINQKCGLLITRCTSLAFEIKISSISSYQKATVCLSVCPSIVQVADFGLSKMSEGVVDGDLTRQHFSSTCGSDFYMAPEVWAGLSYTAQADIFSLGVMFWAVLERITFVEEGTTQEQLGMRPTKSQLVWKFFCAKHVVIASAWLAPIHYLTVFYCTIGRFGWIESALSLAGLFSNFLQHVVHYAKPSVCQTLSTTFILPPDRSCNK